MLQVCNEMPTMEVMGELMELSEGHVGSMLIGAHEHRLDCLVHLLHESLMLKMASRTQVKDQSARNLPQQD